MKHTVSLKNNFEFRRLYAKGRRGASGCMAVYCRPNRLGYSRLGLTVSAKLGGAVVRNRIRRRLREAYRHTEPELAAGYDIVIVARAACVNVPFCRLTAELRRHAEKLGFLAGEGE